MKLFLSRGLYGSRPVSHRDAYHLSPGWLFLELGSWTLEVDYDHAFWARLRSWLMPGKPLYSVLCGATFLSLFSDLPHVAFAAMWGFWTAYELYLGYLIKRKD